MGSCQQGREIEQSIARWKYVVPNALTGLRLCIGLALIGLFLFTGLAMPQIAVILLICAGITDAIDGPLARKYNAVTEFGNKFDHVTDFVMLVYVFLVSVIKQIFWPYLYWPFIVLQLIVAWTAFYRDREKGTVKVEWPNWQGRVAVIVLVTAFCLRVFVMRTGFEKLAICPANLILIPAIVFRTWSLIRYWRLAREGNKR